jgi:glycosyltransferase involved in cell wall biosynthesis
MVQRLRPAVAACARTGILSYSARWLEGQSYGPEGARFLRSSLWQRERNAMIDISVVVPVFNEAESVPRLAEELHGTLSQLRRSYEVLLIDDGSTDASWSKLLEAGRRYPSFRLIRFRRNFGQTAAINAGFREARGSVVITMDADLQNDPRDIPRLIGKTDEGFAVVSGWRKDRKDPLVTRRLPSVIANALISRITGVRLHDYGCTLKAYRREVVDNLQLYGEMHRFIPALASWVGGTLAEVPVGHRARQFGVSKYGLSRTFRVILDLLTVKFLLHYSTRPIQVFGRMGLMFAGAAMVMLLAATVDRLVGVFDPYLLKRPFWVITPFMLILFCMQFISMGLLAELQIRTYHESQSKPTYVIQEIVEPTLRTGDSQ